MTLTLRIISALVVLWMLWDRFETANRWADALESKLPWWARYTGWRDRGWNPDPLTWIQHGITALGFTVWLVLVCALPVWVAWVPFVLYCIREYLPRLQGDTPWDLDGFMDVVGPLLNAVLWSVL